MQALRPLLLSLAVLASIAACAGAGGEHEAGTCGEDGRCAKKPDGGTGVAVAGTRRDAGSGDAGIHKADGNDGGNNDAGSRDAGLLPETLDLQFSAMVVAIDEPEAGEGGGLIGTVEVAPGVTDVTVVVNGVEIPSRPGQPNVFDAALAQVPATPAGEAVRIEVWKDGEVARFFPPCPTEVVIAEPVEGAALTAESTSPFAWTGKVGYWPSLDERGGGAGEAGFLSVDAEGAVSRVSGAASLEADQTSATVRVPPIDAGLRHVAYVRVRGGLYVGRLSGIGGCSLERRVPVTVVPN